MLDFGAVSCLSWINITVSNKSILPTLYCHSRVLAHKHEAACRQNISEEDVHHIMHVVRAWLGDRNV